MGLGKPKVKVEKPKHAKELEEAQERERERMRRMMELESVLRSSGLFGFGPFEGRGIMHHWRPG